MHRIVAGYEVPVCRGTTPGWLDLAALGAFLRFPCSSGIGFLAIWGFSKHTPNSGPPSLLFPLP